MPSNFRLPNPVLVVALILLFVGLSGTTVAAGIVPLSERVLLADDARDRGAQLALARSESPRAAERSHQARFSRESSSIDRANVPGLRSIQSRASPFGIHTTGLDFTTDGDARVVVQTGEPAAVRAAVLAAGGRVERTWRNLVQVIVPAGALPALSKLSSVDVVRPPLRLVEAAVGGEGVGSSLAGAWHQKGFTGEGVKIAVIDGGFAGLADRQAAGDLPGNVVAMDFCGGRFADATDHGTAVAEVVHELAPDAQLYLLCIATDVDLAAAAGFAKSQGVQVINLSGGFYNAGRGDGSGPVGAVVADARAAGILWVNAAGNEAQTHWAGTFHDTNGDRLHEFGPGDIGNTFFWPNGSVVCGALKWDEWPAAASDFDLYLILSSTGQILAGSTGDQSGSQPPTEGGCLENLTGSNLVVAWVMHGYRVAGSPRFDLFTESPPLEYQTAAGSIGDPATSPAALTVGALCWQSRALEFYSSQGPTIDGRTKPDLAGHDSVSSATYGGFAGCPSAFAGTSAASPEVAGAAALVKQAFAGLGPDQLQAFLTRSARDLGASGPDNATGAGELQLPTPPDQISPTARALPSAGKKGGVVRLLSRAGDDSARVQVTEEVRRNGKVTATLRSPFVSSSGGRTIATVWRAPRAADGRFQHCVRARDKAGNTSKPSCAAVTLR